LLSVNYQLLGELDEREEREPEGLRALWELRLDLELRLELEDFLETIVILLICIDQKPLKAGQARMARVP